MGINCVKNVDPLSATIPRSNKLDPSPIIESRLPIIFLTGGPGAGKSLSDTYIIQIIIIFESDTYVIWKLLDLQRDFDEL